MKLADIFGDRIRCFRRLQAHGYRRLRYKSRRRRKGETLYAIPKIGIETWINEAKRIAKKYHTMIIGTSHADGSYKNCGISIPISYFIDSNGEEIYVSKSDTGTRIVNLNTKEVRVI